ncbi:Long-chain fatty alcohol dehydrogenase family protein [Hibiscus syriacus]|uniref:Long-chain fatty alcohol dehydrogenase family protein n=1 Tax=Hibiscus syriacus TaxID=106335 RepID=A0A6A2ZMD0_HIBSY|nr:protein MODIFYING WALL LIGNIN-1-like [Hibiscus syriacus]KAE8693171.1 Long-chain fatty alcohol dehydrogenase family protein [Hibiscus syriacus]
MGKITVRCVLIFSVVASLGLVSFALCLVAEAKRTKAEDLKFDGRLCQVPVSRSFGFVVAALICLSIAQIIGNVTVCANYWSSRSKGKVQNGNAKKPILFLTAFSWVSFGVAVILMSVATSMSRKQSYGEGWLDGECYIVKGGVYISSGLLSLAALSALLGAAAVMTITTPVDQVLKVHAHN